MSFPHTFHGKIYSNSFIKDSFNTPTQRLLKIIFESVKHFKPRKKHFNNDILTFETRYSLININYKVSIKFEKNDVPYVTYEFQTNEYLVIGFIVIFAAAFISGFDMMELFIYSLIFYLFFYLINVWFVNYSLRHSIKKSPAFIDHNKNYNLEALFHIREASQKTGQCQVCHSYIEKSAIYCPSCGYKFFHNYYYLPVNITKYSSKPLNYFSQKKPTETVKALNSRLGDTYFSREYTST